MSAHTHTHTHAHTHLARDDLVFVERLTAREDNARLEITNHTSSNKLT